MPRLPTFQDVSTQPIQRDPGVSARADAFSSDAGVVASELAPAVDEVGDAFRERDEAIAAANERILVRKESLDRLKKRREFRTIGKQQYETIKRQEDISSEDVLKEYGQFLRAKMDELGGAHDGREESKLRLTELLETDFSEFSDDAGLDAIEVSDALADDEAEQVIGGLEARVANGENPFLAIKEGMDNIVPGTELANSMRRGKEILYESNLNNRLMSAAIERLIPGDIEEAEDLLFDPTVQRRLSGTNRREFLKRIDKIRRKSSEPFTLGPGGGRFENNELVASMPAASAPVVSIVQKGEEAMSKELGKLDAKRVVDIENNAQIAFRTLGEVERMQAAIESGRFQTGVFSDARLFLTRFANFVGASDEVLQLLGDAATADTLDAATNRLAVDAAQKLGRITNMSLEFIRNSLPNLTRTPQGNVILMEVMKRTAEREIQLASMANDYVSRHGTLRPQDEKSYFESVRDLEEEDPVITPELREKIMEGSKSPTKTFKERFGEAKAVVDSVVDADLPKLSTQEEVDAFECGKDFLWGPSNKRARKPCPEG